MAKRRSKEVHLPEDVLFRARQNAGISSEEKSVGGFEEALQRAKKKAAADELEKKKKERKEQQSVLDAEEVERKRVEAVRRSPEWKEMRQLVKSASFRAAVSALWERRPETTKKRERVTDGYDIVEVKRDNIVMQTMLGSERVQKVKLRDITFDESVQVVEEPEYIGYEESQSDFGRIIISFYHHTYTYHQGEERDDWNVEISLFKRDGEEVKIEAQLTSDSLATKRVNGVMTIDEFYERVAERVVSGNWEKYYPSY